MTCSIGMTESNMDVIWSTGDELPHFTSENCLPDIGSCQVSSILSTLEKVPSGGDPQDSFKSIAFSMVSGGSSGAGEDAEPQRSRQLYEEMVFFGCNLCPFICTKDSKISDHISSVHGDSRRDERARCLKCPGCSNVFHHRLSLRSHLIYDHEVGKSDINKIVNGIVYVSSLINNENNKLTKQPDDMKRSVDAESDVEVSAEVAGGHEAKVECDEPDVQPSAAVTTTARCSVAACKVRMRDPSNLAYHVRSHAGDGVNFACVECGERCAAWRTLQTHLWRAHSLDVDMYACDKCTYRTHSLAKLNNVHRLIHGEEKPFLCDDCGKGFKNRKQLRNHKLVHRARTEDVMAVRHECATCGRVFSDRRQLRVHQASVHDKIKPYACSHCGYRAASNGALKLHTRQHTGERPFSCDKCDYTTSDHNSMRRHKLRHSGIKKYNCSHCAYACIQSSTYKTHVRTKHPGQDADTMHACQLCQYRSLSRDKYLVHMATQHPLLQTVNT